MKGRRFIGAVRRRSAFAFATAAAAVFAFSADAWAQQVIVVGNGPGQIPSIPTAVGMTQSGDTVLVTSGTWPGPVNLTGRNITLISTFPNSPGLTTITANGANAVITMNSSNTNATTIDGFTITGGVRIGIDCGSSASPSTALINRCDITTNGSTTGANADSGGVFNLGGTIQNSTVQLNVSRSQYGGGGILLAGGTVSNCLILDNKSMMNGGGGISGNGTTVSISGCTINRNEGLWGGGIDNFQGVVTNCQFLENKATSTSGQAHGGAIANATFTFGGSIDHCTMRGHNVAGQGGAIYHVTAGGTVTANRIFDNGAAGGGGGLALCASTMTNNQIFKNTTALNGGGFFDCDGDMLNNSIVKNNADNRGGAARNCDGLIKNNIIWDNTAGTADPKLSNSSNPHFCVINGGNNNGGSNNKGGDPLLVDTTNAILANWNLHLQSSSSSAANNGATLTAVPTDFDGQARPQGGVFDIGAFEDF